MKISGLVKKCATATAATAVVATSAWAFGTSPAAASQSEGAGPPSDCRLFAGEPRLSPDGHTITGLGTSRCMGTGWEDQKLVVTLEAKPLPWLYLVVAQASTEYTSSPSLEQTVSWPCTPGVTGVYTIETSWYGKDGELYSFKYPGTSITLTCAS
jgi:hypothetical protein